ncbi:MAG: TIR domain-containing protein [Bacteroidales bacterium]|nr:TIR domain-containing protein [Bacteroidales bacterium]
MKTRSYHYNNSTITIVFGDILDSKAEVIVSSDDTGISMSGGVSGAILRKGGEIIREDAQKKLPAQMGDVIVSTSGALQYQKYVFHCLTLDFDYKMDTLEGRWANSDDMNNYILQHSVDKCFRLLQVLDLHSMAFPCIGAGLAHIPLEQVAENMADVISSNLCKTQKPYEIELYLYESTGFDNNRKKMSEMDYIDMFEKFAIKSALYQHEVEIHYQPAKETSDSPVTGFMDIPKREEMDHEVFISYSRKDMESVNVIRELLDRNGISYWIDKEGIFSGENYKEVIVDAIETARAVLFVSSEHSNESINVIRELGYAVKQSRTIIPVLLDDTPYAKSVRLDIADIHQIDFKEIKSAEKELITSIRYVLGIQTSKQQEQS